MGTLIEFRRTRTRTESRKTASVVLAARRGEVTLTADETEAKFSPAQARELGESLIELAEDAEWGVR